MIPYIQLPNDPVVVMAQRLREFAETAEAIKSRLRDIQCGRVDWATVGSAAHCVEELEQIAAFIGVPGFEHR